MEHEQKDFTFRVSILQFEPLFGDVHTNLDRIEAMCSGLKTDLLILPELCATGYLFESREEILQYAESVKKGGPILDRFRKISHELDCILVAGFAEYTEAGPMNSAVIIDDKNGLIDIYRKIHLFDREKELFEEGNLGFRVWNIRNVRIGIMICYDWYFPESARILALKGVDIIAHPSNLVLPYCQSVLPARALENKVFIFMANRTGTDKRENGAELSFTGRSMGVSPKGEILLECTRDETCVKSIDINPYDARNKWLTPRNHAFHDRRPAYYTQLGIPFPDSLKDV